MLKRCAGPTRDWQFSGDWQRGCLDVGMAAAYRQPSTGRAACLWPCMPAGAWHGASSSSCSSTHVLMG